MYVILHRLVLCNFAGVKCPTDSRKRPDQRLLEGGKVCLSICLCLWSACLSVSCRWCVSVCLSVLLLYHCVCCGVQIDEAADEKHRLEEKQRASRKQREKKGEEWKPLWVLTFVCVCACVCIHACMCVCVCTHIKLDVTICQRMLCLGSLIRECMRYKGMRYLSIVIWTFLAIITRTVACHAVIYIGFTCASLYVVHTTRCNLITNTHSSQCRLSVNRLV